ncbi:SHOCT domain-containing protein [Anaerotignum lactatifermentans]|uniref:SHOCT domain-containing protein n=1 Tax=Anaerotignum lactatifermentans TaxID=160404 RepID=UPI001FAF384A|nr:SHOCT domain-containing protein [Anaerotignum lactatifermentans]
MEICSGCGKKSLMVERYGQVRLCKVCALKVLTPTWKHKEYRTNEEVERQKEKVRMMAEKSGFMPQAIEGLERYFDHLRIEGLVKKLDGGKGQKLVLCEKECMMETTDDFNFKEAEKAYRKIQSGHRGGGTPLDEIINSQMAIGILSEVVGSALPGGGLVKNQIKRAGRNLAAQTISGKLMDETEQRTEVRSLAYCIRTGERRAEYSQYDRIQYIEPVGEETYGFLLLQNSRRLDDPAEDVIFFFDSSTETKKEANQAYGFIKSRLADPMEEEGEEELPPQQTAGNTLAEEILMYKRLLDLGAITQEEYDAKKKQLLNL